MKSFHNPLITQSSEGKSRFGIFARNRIEILLNKELNPEPSVATGDAQRIPIIIGTGNQKKTDNL